MKKKIIPLFLAAAVSVSGVLPIGAVQPVTVMAENGHPARLVDNAGLLDEDEALELESKLDEISQEYDCDVVILTEETINGAEPMDYADDYFDYEGYGMGEDNSGILFLITMSERKWWISTHGEAIYDFTDAGQEYMAEQFQSDLSDGYYYDSFTTFTDLCQEFLVQAQTGEPFDKGNLPEKPLSPWALPISIGIGLVLALIITGIMRGQMKTVRMKPDAADYMVDGSLQITRSNDVFLYHQVTKTAKPKDDDSGGSSVHTSSSGETHGGSGGSF